MSAPPPRTGRQPHALVALLLVALVAVPIASAARPRPPVNSSPPTISGTAQEGQDLAASTGTWNSASPPTYTYQWRRCADTGWSCVDIAGATASTLRLTSADVGHTMKVRVTARNAAGSRSATSSPTALVQAQGGPAQTPGVWRPAPGTTFHWQLTGTLDMNVDVTAYDIDLFDTSASTVSSLHGSGRKVICYLSAGSWEDWRPDAGRFPAEVLGRTNGWPGEKWLDIRRLDVLGPIMEARLDLCKSKGFDAVEPDNVDGYTNSTGFPLTASDQLRYNRFLADAAHVRGLSVGLKNDLEQVTALLPSFDWALNEECYRYNECSLLMPFIDAGKAVFQVEYGSDTSFCTDARARRFTSQRKHLNLDAWRAPC